MSTKGRELPDGSPCSHKVSEKCHKRGIKAGGELSGLLLDYRPCRLQRHFSCSTPKFFCEGRTRTPSRVLIPPAFSLCPTLSLLCSYRKIKFWVESLVRSAWPISGGRSTSPSSSSSATMDEPDFLLLPLALLLGSLFDGLSFFPPSDRKGGASGHGRHDQVAAAAAAALPLSFQSRQLPSLLVSPSLAPGIAAAAAVIHPAGVEAARRRENIIWAKLSSAQRNGSGAVGRLL